MSDTVSNMGRSRREGGTRRTPEIVKVLLLPIINFGGGLLRSVWSWSQRPVTSHHPNSAMEDQFYPFRKQMQEAAEALPNEAPRPLPAVRKRALTLPLSQPQSHFSGYFWERRQETADQLQSSLFGRFPLEVRELVYKHYLAPPQRCVHVFRRPDRRLAHYFCTGGHESHSHMPLRKWGYDQITCTRAWRKDDKRLPLASSTLLPLLKTCRRA